jgi:hypothetical protein
MGTHKSLLIVLTVLSISYGCAYECFAQVAASELQTMLPNIFAKDDFNALLQGEPIVKLMSATDHREIAVAGLVRLQVPAEIFLDSYQQNMTRKNDEAILQIGAFSDPPNLNDLDALTVDDRDIEDLKRCTVGDCRLKLSASMIERFQQEIDWQAPDYSINATKLYKQMLVEYIQNYLTRGDVALIHYDDKSETIDLNKETRELLKNSSYQSIAGDSFRSTHPQKSSPVESRIVWSKVKFGLKPVISINHILISKSAAKILVVSKQLYANHYFESSVGLTTYFTFAGKNPESYLYYENHSLLDGFGGPFGKIKQSIVEDGAIAGLKSILSNSQASLNARALNLDNPTSGSVLDNQTSKGRKIGKVHFILLLVWIVALITMIRAYGWKLLTTKRQKSSLSNSFKPAHRLSNHAAPRSRTLMNPNNR